MKFFHSILLTLGASSAAFASPIHEKRASGAVAAIDSALSTAISAVTQYDTAISVAANALKNDVSAEVQIIADINVDLANIVSSLAKAGASFVNITVGAAGGLVTTAANFTQAEITTLTKDLNEAITLIENIRATLTVTASNLTPALKVAIMAEYLAVLAIITPFVAPLTVFASAVSNASASASLTVTGLDTAIAGLANIAAATLMSSF